MLDRWELKTAFWTEGSLSSIRDHEFVCSVRLKHLDHGSILDAKVRHIDQWEALNHAMKRLMENFYEWKKHGRAWKYPHPSGGFMYMCEWDDALKSWFIETSEGRRYESVNHNR